MKYQLRKKHKEQRESIPAADILLKSRKIKENLFSLPEYWKAKAVLFYVSTGNEVSTLEMIEESLKEKRVVVPKTNREEKTLTLCKIGSIDDLEEGCFGIFEPHKVEAVTLGEIDLIIVPGIAFDCYGHRIGHGHGYYDRLLEKTKARKIGLAFEMQLVEKIPSQEHDVRVDKIVTEIRIIKAS